MDYLLQRISRYYSEKDIFYNLEPILQKRKKYESEENLIYILKKIINKEGIKKIYEDLIKYKMLTPEVSCLLISNIHFGLTLIYPSELKRARVPICVYNYILTNYSDDISFENIIYFWDNKILNKKI